MVLLIKKKKKNHKPINFFGQYAIRSPKVLSIVYEKKNHHSDISAQKQETNEEEKKYQTTNMNMESLRKYSILFKLFTS